MICWSSSKRWTDAPQAGLSVDDKATIQTQSRYNRIAPVYDLLVKLIVIRTKQGQI
jgi:hypothetical protein